MCYRTEHSQTKYRLENGVGRTSVYLPTKRNTFLSSVETSNLCQEDVRREPTTVCRERLRTQKCPIDSIRSVNLQKTVCSTIKERYLKRDRYKDGVFL